MPDKFRVHLTRGLWQDPWPDYFENFYRHCKKIAHDNNWHEDTVINYQLKPHGKLVITRTQGWYLRWDDEKQHTMFVLKWS